MGTVNVTLGDGKKLNLILGQQLENAVTAVVFDFSAWQTEFGSGTLGLSVQRHGDTQPYAVVLSVSGTNATWSISSLDTAYKGIGEIQLTYTVGTAIKKSVIYKFTVYQSLGENGEYPSPGQTWQEEIEDEITDVKQDLSNIKTLETSILNPIPQIAAGWRTGYYISTTGVYDTWTRAICTKVPVELNEAIGFYAIAPSGYFIEIEEYNSSGTFVRSHGNFNVNAGTQTPYIIANVEKGHKVNITIGMFPNGTGSSYLTNDFVGQVYIAPFYNDENTVLTSRVYQGVENWQTGHYARDTGAYDTWTRAICSINPYVATSDCIMRVLAPEGYDVIALEYNSSGTFVKAYGGFVPGGGILANALTIKATKGYKYQYAVGYFTNADALAHLTQDFIDSICIYTDSYEMPYDIISTNDTTDRTAEIQSILNNKGVCNFGKGIFCTTGVIMPDGGTITGCGNKTDIRLLDSTDTNLWTFGSKTFTQEVIVEFDNPLPAGRYLFEADIVSDADVSVSLVTFYTGSPYTWSSTGSGRSNVSHGTGQSNYILATKPFKAIGLYSANTYSASAGKTATFSNVSLKRLPTAIILGSDCTVKNLQITGSSADITTPTSYGGRNGIGYYGSGSSSTIKRGVIDGCFIHGFSGGGIDLNNTGYGSQGLNVANCYVYNCYCGFHCVHFSEFHRVTGCSFAENYIGVVNNGGNNQFTSNNISSNSYGIVMDNSSGIHNNGTHGGCVGCIFQHNTEASVYINNEVSGFMFSGCNIDPDTDENDVIEIINSTRIIFNACNFMAYFDAIITNGGLVLFNACNFRSTLQDGRLHITNNNAVRFTSCYTNDGTAVNPV